MKDISVFKLTYEFVFVCWIYLFGVEEELFKEFRTNECDGYCGAPPRFPTSDLEHSFP